jgi:hypothetical protein
MIQVVLSIVILVGMGFAEWKHHKTGNGKRFEQIHDLIKADKTLSK